MKSPYEHRSMQDLPAEQQAAKAIKHVLQRMRTDGRLYHLMGFGTESFDLLTEAYSTLTGEDLAALRKFIASA